MLRQGGTERQSLTLSRVARRVPVWFSRNQMKDNVMQKFMSYLSEENGASAAEYALILAIVGTGIAAAAVLLGDAISDAIGRATTIINAN